MPEATEETELLTVPEAAGLLRLQTKHHSQLDFESAPAFREARACRAYPESGLRFSGH
jgi:hypothetical protein